MKKILLLSMFISFSYSQIELYNKDYYSFNRDSINNSNNAMIKSFLIPGWGQIQNKEPLWKPAVFFGIEILGIFSIYKYDKKAEMIRHDFESFADKHWGLERWYNNTKKIFPDKWKEILIGTHKLELNINGNYYYSDQLVSLSNNYPWGSIKVVRDRDFYENIGKYDQFVGGWDDPYDNPFDQKGNWYTIKKGKYESIILTEQKDYYRDLRDKSNLLKHYAKYSVTIVMLNHLVSGIEASLNKSRIDNYLPKIHFYQYSHTSFLVKGVKISYEW